MADVTATDVKPRRRGWWRKLAWIVGGLFVLLIVFYFVATSEPFFKAVILPRVSKALNAQVTVADASIKPFSQIILRDLKVQAGTGEPLATVREVRARYYLVQIAGGKLDVDDIAIVDPVLNVVRRADGSSNLDPILQSRDKKEKKPGRSERDSARQQIDLKRFLLTNATVRLTKEHQGGGRDVTELANVNVVLANLKNGQTASFNVGADLKVDNRAPTPGTNASLEAKLTGAFTLGLSPDLRPASVQGDARFEVARASGALADTAGAGVLFKTDATPSEIKEVSIRLQKSGTALGELVVSGPFDLAKSEGTLRVELRNIDRQALGLAGAAAGMDFGQTVISSTNQIQVTQGGKVANVGGQITLAKLSVTKAGQTTPTLDLACAYDVVVDSADKLANLRTLRFTGTQEQRPILLGSLTAPMTVAWAETAGNVPDAAFRLTLTNLTLADWRPFIGTNIQSGVANGTITVASMQSGKQLKVDLASRLDGLSVRAGEKRLNDVMLTADAHAEATELKQVKLNELAMRMSRGKQSLVNVRMDGDLNTATKAADLTTSVEATLPDLLQLAGLTNVALDSGQLRLQGRLTQQPATTSRTATPAAQSLVGTLALTNLSGRQGDKRFTNLFTVADLAVETKDQVVDLRQLHVLLAPTGRAATNEVQLTGRMDLSNTNGIRGTLQLNSDSLDLTSYYDAFAGQTRQPGPTESQQPSAPTPGGGRETEPEPVRLPFQDFRLESNIRRLYVRDLEITNLQAAVKINGSRVTVKPLELAINGAPVRGSVDLNLGTPGYVYDLSFAADRVPIEPLANTFSPEYRGRAKGELLADIQVKGAGITGTSLRTNLQGQFNIVFTNADIQIAGPRLKRFLAPIAAVLRAPDLLGSPLHGFVANGRAGDGVIEIGQVRLVSPAFTADTGGKVPIAESLKQSPLQKWPMSFALRRSLAEKIKLVTRDTPTNATYVRLPDFLRVAGTVNEPKPDIDAKALAGSAIEVLTEKIPGLDEKTRGIIKGVGEILKGQKQASTNAPATNRPSRFNPLDLLNKPKE